MFLRHASVVLASIGLVVSRAEATPLQRQRAPTTLTTIGPVLHLRRLQPWDDVRSASRARGRDLLIGSIGLLDGAVLFAFLTVAAVRPGCFDLGVVDGIGGELACPDPSSARTVRSLGTLAGAFGIASVAGFTLGAARMRSSPGLLRPTFTLGLASPDRSTRAAALSVHLAF